MHCTLAQGKTYYCLQEVGSAEALLLIQPYRLHIQNSHLHLKRSMQLKISTLLQHHLQCIKLSLTATNHDYYQPINQKVTENYVSVLLSEKHEHNSDEKTYLVAALPTWRPLLLLVCLVVQFSRFTISSRTTSSIWLWCSSRGHSPVSGSSTLHSDALSPFISITQNTRNQSISN